MKIKRFLISTTAAVFCLVNLGCQSRGAYTADIPNAYDLENQTSFVMMNKRVAQSVTVAGLQERVLEDGRLEVTANVLSRDKKRVQVQISCVFKNEDGFPYGDETPWNTLILTENAQEGVRFSSMNSKARKYTIRVREAR
ncbi:MAG: YcfL family protein [Verrucomicrobiota bacterium]|nr:YcfL family protein [Verrucomicrobiota bacterium]